MAEKKSSRVGAVVAGIAGLTAAAVGAYYLYGHKDADKHRAKIKGWMLKAKGEVLDELESVKDVSESSYMSAVDAIARKYRELKDIDVQELEAFIGEMRDHWQGIQKTFQTRGKKVDRKAAKKPKAAARKPSVKK